MLTEQVLGIDAGGTHTDAVLVSLDPAGHGARLLASAKALTNHDDLASSVAEVAGRIAAAIGDAGSLERIGRVTLGTTLEINALVQGKSDAVGLALSGGPGLDPRHFALGEHVCLVTGGMDHRGVEVDGLVLDRLRRDARTWAHDGVAAIGCVGKFSPRNPSHEIMMARTAHAVSGLPVSMGHSLSGQLNFPRRIATTYYNAAVQRLHDNFLDSVERALGTVGISAPVFLLKADGGSVPSGLSRREPVQSILSGPAASVMGVMALWPELSGGCTVLMDMGGTTTDMAIFIDGFPVMDRDGMQLLGRRTLVRALASVSIGVGGDSEITVTGFPGSASVETGPQRNGPAMCFGGAAPTLMDALNMLDGSAGGDRGDVAASRAGMSSLAGNHGFSDGGEELARLAVGNALEKIGQALSLLLAEVNGRPIYTLSELKTVEKAVPARVCLVGGPAACMRERLGDHLGLPVSTPDHAAVANAIGAALTMPTAGLEIYVDTGKGLLRAPALDVEEKIGRGFSLDDARKRTAELLGAHLGAQGISPARIDIVNADLFATLDDRGYGSKDMRVSGQVRPALAARLF